MGYSTTPTVAAGDVFPAAHWNTYVRGNFDHFANPPRCLAYSTANQGSLTTAGVALSFLAEGYDTDTMHSTATNPSRITFTTPGYYAGTATVALSMSTVAGSREIQILKNSTSIVAVARESMPSTIDASILNVSFDNRFGTNDYIEVRVTHTHSGVSLTAVGAADGAYPYLTARWYAQFST